MKHTHILPLLIAITLSSCGALKQTPPTQPAKPVSMVNNDYEKYILTYYPAAVEQMIKHNIPASITLAQGLLESGAGKSLLARTSNNHFGIKADKSWKGKRRMRQATIKRIYPFSK